MKKIFNYLATVAIIGGAFTFAACSDDDDKAPAVVYEQEDQMARPAINTVFIGAGAPKDAFNEITPSAMGAAYATIFNDRLLALNAGYTTNALSQNAATFTGLLATDVLNVALTGETTFFNPVGPVVLTGRKLEDDVISTELLLIFGGPAGTSNPTLTDDHVSANDKAFLGTFPYLAAPF
jgi:Domain of unknown function (DUF4331)